MDIPLLFLDEKDSELGKKYYPGLQIATQDYASFNPEYFIQQYDVLFLSDLWDRHTFHQKFAPLEKKYNKVLRHVHVPHGYSDKAFYLKKCANEDITLIYGQNMLDMLKENKVWDQVHEFVLTGNYRYTFFKQHAAFYRQLVQQEILSQFDQPRPVILYAPTWMDLEESSTFFTADEAVLGKLPSYYNLIVKLHPRLELDDPAAYHRIMGKYEHKKNILFLTDFPLVYPLLDCATLYIGDMSSIGYDFLAFDKPLFFLNQQKRDSRTDRGLYLFRCGLSVLPHHYIHLYELLAENLEKDLEEYSAIRQEVYTYTFGKERSFATIKADICTAYEKDYYH